MKLLTKLIVYLLLMKTPTTMQQVHSLKSKMTAEFIDHCNEKGIDLVKWYRWQLHLIWEQRKINRKYTNLN